MPIRTEWRCYYGRDWREVIRPRILGRAGGRCERCGKPDRMTVWTLSGANPDGSRWMLWRRTRYHLWTDHAGASIPSASSPPGLGRRVLVVLTVAHLNHDPTDNRDENLAALCQWCHLNHDRAHHRQTRAARKDATRPLLLGAASEGGTDATMPNLRLHG